MTPSDKDLSRAEDIRNEMIGPRCPDCGGCDVNVAATWAGEEYGWCNCCTEHEFIPMCGPCGRPMDTAGSPPVCHSCGGCYEAPRECLVCGQGEATSVGYTNDF